MTEEWRTIERAPDYEVSDQGRVRRAKPDWQGKYAGRILRPGTARSYVAYRLSTPEGPLTLKAHRLVCEAFNGPCPPGKDYCAHRDGDTKNNTPSNLYWATPQENCADREAHGRTARGSRSGATLHPEAWKRGDEHWTRQHPERVLRGDRHPRRLRPACIPRGSDVHSAKLTEEDVRIILATPKVHGSGRALAERFGVSMGLISAIRKGRSWTHLER